MKAITLSKVVRKLAKTIDMLNEAAERREHSLAAAIAHKSHWQSEAERLCILLAQREEELVRVSGVQLQAHPAPVQDVS